MAHIAKNDYITLSIGMFMGIILSIAFWYFVVIFDLDFKPDHVPTNADTAPAWHWEDNWESITTRMSISQVKSILGEPTSLGLWSSGDRVKSMFYEGNVVGSGNARGIIEVGTDGQVYLVKKPHFNK